MEGNPSYKLKFYSVKRLAVIQMHGLAEQQAPIHRYTGFLSEYQVATLIKMQGLAEPSFASMTPRPPNPFQWYRIEPEGAWDRGSSIKKVPPTEQSVLETLIQQLRS